MYSGTKRRNEMEEEKGKEIVVSILKATVDVLRVEKQIAMEGEHKEYLKGKITGICIAIDTMERYI